jgi:hypothetical protein
MRNPIFTFNLLSEKDQKTLDTFLTLPPFSCLHILWSFSHHCVFFSYALFSKSNVTQHTQAAFYQYGEKLSSHLYFQSTSLMSSRLCCCSILLPIRDLNCRFTFSVLLFQQTVKSLGFLCVSVFNQLNYANNVLQCWPIRLQCCGAKWFLMLISMEGLCLLSGRDYCYLHLKLTSFWGNFDVWFGA